MKALTIDIKYDKRSDFCEQSVDQNGNMIGDAKAIEDAVKYQANRTVTVARWIKNAKESQ